MIQHDIFKMNLDDCDISDFRYLMYLSRNNAWVNAGGELYKITIKNIIETTERIEGDTTYYDKKLHPVSSQYESGLKLYLSKTAMHLDVFGKSSSVSQIEASGHKKLPDLHLDVVGIDFTNLDIGMNGCSVNLHVEVENYDLCFFNKINKADVDTANQSVTSYAVDRLTAFQDSAKNAIWLAAVSGDHQQLSILLDKHSSFDLYQKYKGKNIIQAIFSTNPKQDLPFNGDKPDYKTTLAVLVAKGFDFHKSITPGSSQTYMDICNEYRKAQNNLWFFQAGNSVHQLFLSEIDNIVETVALDEKEVSVDHSKEGGLALVYFLRNGRNSVK